MNEVTEETKKRGRFVLSSRESGLDTVISEHRTFTEAETYRDALGRPGKHLSLNIVDRSENVIKDKADADEQAMLDAALLTEKKRGELLTVREENARREKDLKAGSVREAAPKTASQK